MSQIEVVVVGLGNMGNAFVQRAFELAKAACALDMNRVAFWNANTHVGTLDMFSPEGVNKLQLGPKRCGGRGTNRDMVKGREAWEETLESGMMREVIPESAKLLMPVVGLGGGCGQGTIDGLLEYGLDLKILVVPTIAYPAPHEVAVPNLRAARATLKWIKEHGISRYVIDNEAVYQDVGEDAPTIFANQVPTVAEGIVGNTRLFLDLQATYKTGLDESNAGLLFDGNGNLLSGGGVIDLTVKGFDERLSTAMDKALRNDAYYQFGNKTAAALVVLKGPWTGFHEGAVQNTLNAKLGNSRFVPLIARYPAKGEAVFQIIRTDRTGEPVERNYRWMVPGTVSVSAAGIQETEPVKGESNKPNGGAGRPVLPGEPATLTAEPEAVARPEQAAEAEPEQATPEDAPAADSKPASEQSAIRLVSSKSRDITIAFFTAIEDGKTHEEAVPSSLGKPMNALRGRLAPTSQGAAEAILREHDEIAKGVHDFLLRNKGVHLTPMLPPHLAWNAATEDEPANRVGSRMFTSMMFSIATAAIRKAVGA